MVITVSITYFLRDFNKKFIIKNQVTGEGREEKMKRIKQLRLNLGYTQEALAKEINVSQATVALWESGTVMPNAKKLPEIASVLKCKVDDLYGE